MKNKVLLVLLASVLVLSLVAASCAAPAPAEVIEWKAQSLFGPEDTCTTIQAQQTVDVTNEALEGKLHTTLYIAGQIVPEEEMCDALGRGVYDAALTVPMIRSDAGIVAFGLPYGWENVDQVIEFYYDYGFLDFMREVDAEKNIFFVGPLPWGPVTLMTKFPVHKIEDLKGKKIWAEGPTAALVEALGGEPVWFPPGEMYMGLKLGTIDGTFFGEAELEVLKLKEVVDYIIRPSPITPLCVDWIVSLDSWNALTPDMQQAYEEAFRNNLRRQYEDCMVSIREGADAAVAVGVEITVLEPSELERFRALSMTVWDDVAASDPQSAQAVQMLKDYLTSKGILK